ncbi:MAG: hypothetical protein V2B20_01910 [Pseudomonadota bacterium]
MAETTHILHHYGKATPSHLICSRCLERKVHMLLNLIKYLNIFSWLFLANLLLGAIYYFPFSLFIPDNIWTHFYFWIHDSNDAAQIAIISVIYFSICRYFLARNNRYVFIVISSILLCSILFDISYNRYNSKQEIEITNNIKLGDSEIYLLMFHKIYKGDSVPSMYLVRDKNVYSSDECEFKRNPFMLRLVKASFILDSKDGEFKNVDNYLIKFGFNERSGDIERNIIHDYRQSTNKENTYYSRSKNNTVMRISRIEDNGHTIYDRFVFTIGSKIQ